MQIAKLWQKVKHKFLQAMEIRNFLWLYGFNIKNSLLHNFSPFANITFLEKNNPFSSWNLEIKPMDLFCFQLWLSNKNMYDYENSLSFWKLIFDNFLDLLKVAFRRLIFSTLLSGQCWAKKEALFPLFLWTWGMLYACRRSK